MSHTLVRTINGHLLAGGCGKYGQLGNGDLWDRDEPVVVPTVRSIVAFAAGDRHTIAVCQCVACLTWDYDPISGAK